MKDIKISDINLYENDNQLFIGYGDGFLIKIEGEDLTYIREILDSLKNNQEYTQVDELYKRLSSAAELEKEYYFSLLDWLRSNGIIVSNLDEDEEKVKYNYNVSVIGLQHIESSSILDKIGNNISKGEENFKFNLVEAEEGLIDFCLVFSPMLNKEVNGALFEELYRKKIPHIYIDYSKFSVTLGPAINPSLKMPCLNCYFKRRIANTSSPKAYLSLIKLDNKQIRHISIKNTNVYNTLVEWLSNELIRLIYSNWESASILGKSKTLNFIIDDFSTARILKTVNCKICNKREVKRPLNG